MLLRIAVALLMTKENITDETPHSLKLKMRHSLGETLFHVAYRLSVALIRTCAALIDIVIPKKISCDASIVHLHMRWISSSQSLGSGIVPAQPYPHLHSCRPFTHHDLSQQRDFGQVGALPCLDRSLAFYSTVWTSASRVPEGHRK